MPNYMDAARMVQTERLDEKGRSTGLIAIRRVRDGSYEVLAKQTVSKVGSNRPHTSRVILYISAEQAAHLLQAFCGPWE